MHQRNTQARDADTVEDDQSFGLPSDDSNASLLPPLAGGAVLADVEDLAPQDSPTSGPDGSGTAEDELAAVGSAEEAVVAVGPEEEETERKESSKLSRRPSLMRKMSTRLSDAHQKLVALRASMPILDRIGIFWHRLMSRRAKPAERSGGC